MGNNDVYAVIADKTRRGILTALKDGERPVGDLVAELGVSQPTVSKHLKILREAGMVSMEAQGQRRLYAVQPEPLAAVTDWIHEVVGGSAGEVSAPQPIAEQPTAADAGVTEPTAADAAPTEDRDTAVTEGTGTAVDTGAHSPAAAAPRPVAPGPELPPGGTPARPGRGAGARAADLLSGLSGLRRRSRHPRR